MPIFWRFHVTGDKSGPTRRSRRSSASSARGCTKPATATRCPSPVSTCTSTTTTTR
jgi:hypothetical protein